MPDYRRKRVPGGTYFFTVNLLDRRTAPRRTLISPINKQLFRSSRLTVKK